jgi:hypothetical protein
MKTAKKFLRFIGKVVLVGIIETGSQQLNSIKRSMSSDALEEGNQGVVCLLEKIKDMVRYGI